MSNLSDKELDRLSREAAEKFEAEQSPAAWNRLEQLLDKELGRPSPLPGIKRPGTPFLYPAGFLLMIGVTYFLLKTTTHNTTSTQKNHPSVIQPATNKAGQDKSFADSVLTKNNGASVDQQLENSHSSPGENEQQDIDQRLSNNKSTATVDKTTKQAVTGATSLLTPGNHYAGDIQHQNPDATPGVINYPIQKAGKKYNMPSAAGIDGTRANSELYIAHNGNTKGYDKYQKKITSGKTEKNINDSYLTENISQKIKDDNKIKSDPGITSITGLQPLNAYNGNAMNDFLLKRLSLASQVADMPRSTQKNKNNSRKLVTSRKLQIGVLFSPDFSQVRYNYNNRIGSNFGITLGYQLSGRISINTGLILNSKNYNTDGFDFHAPPNSWLNRVHLDFVKGHCNMFEIPLTIRYDFNRDGNTAFFVSGGLSSYLMMKERYVFYYHDNFAGFARSQNDDYNSRHSYLFSALNLSGGFETKISNSVSFQVEPYLKLPLTGIGFGKVNLSSYGINLSIKFAPALKKSKQ